MVKRKFQFNPFSNRLDGAQSVDDLDDRYVEITGDTMTGDLFLTSGKKIYFDAYSYLVKNGNTVELWVNSTLSASWGEDAPAIATGEPIGLLLSLTYKV